jgi:hypothetical protein
MGLQGTINDWRNDLFELITKYKKEGFDLFEWSTARDKHVCDKCKKREGIKYTEKEIIEELNGEFCTPGDKDDRCRCIILPVV